jgi:hypothetical protein
LAAGFRQCETPSGPAGTAHLAVGGSRRLRPGVATCRDGGEGTRLRQDYGGQRAPPNDEESLAYFRCAVRRVSNM